MADPFFHHPRQTIKRWLGKGHINRCIELVRPWPIFIRCFSGQNINRGLVTCIVVTLQFLHAYLQLHGGMIGDHNAAIIQRHHLIAEQQFSRTNLQRIGHTIEYVAQNNLRHLFNKQRWKLDLRTTRDRHICIFKTVILGQKITKSQHCLIIVNNIFVCNFKQISWHHRYKWIFGQFLVECQFSRA